MEVPEIIQIKTLDYLKTIQEFQNVINQLQKQNLSLIDNCNVYRLILSKILSTETKKYDKRIYINLQDILDILEKELKKIK